MINNIKRKKRFYNYLKTLIAEDDVIITLKLRLLKMVEAKEGL